MIGHTLCHSTTWAKAVTAVLSMTCLAVSTSPVVCAEDDRLRVVATTPILGDFARQVGSDHVEVTTLLSSDAEALSFEPTLRDMAEISSADLLLTNHLNLEPEALMRALESARKPGAELLRVAEDIPTYDGQLIPLVEDAALDTAWLGFAVHRTQAPVTLRISHSEGSGDVTAFITGALGQPQPVLQSQGNAELTLAPGSHTHLSWSFTQPGHYEVELTASSPASGLYETSSLSFEVGVPSEVPKSKLIDHGHWDITVTDPVFTAQHPEPSGHRHAGHDTHSSHRVSPRDELMLVGDNPDGSHIEIPLDGRTVLVPPATLIKIPQDARYAFLRQSGSPGSSQDTKEVYLLAQAVVGRHLHGEVDPHVWLSPTNAQAGLTVISHALGRLDPAHADDYAAHARSSQRRIKSTYRSTQALLQKLPAARRFLITDYDSLRYFASAYDLTVAGFIARHTQEQPSTRQLVTVSRSISSLEMPTVFVDAASLATNAGTGTADLGGIAADRRVAACPIYVSSFDSSAGVTDYLSLLTTTAYTMFDCLTRKYNND